MSTKTSNWSQIIASFVCAEQAYSEGQSSARVEALLAPALAQKTEFGPALALRGLLALDKGRLAQALTDADRAIAACPAEMRGHYVRGRVRLERGTAGALADLERAVVLSQRKDAAVLHWLAAALYQAGRSQDAIKTQREAVRLHPAAGELEEQLRQFERTSASR